MALEKKYIAFLDILGFKDLVENNTHERLYELYDKVFSQIIILSLSNGRAKILDDGKTKTFHIETDTIKVNCVTISDSIIIWTDDNSMTSFTYIVEVVRTLLNYIFKTGIPLRGAIVEGHLDKIGRTIISPKDTTQTTLIGAGLVKAYLKEGIQKWSGCILDESCVVAYNKEVEKYKTIVKDVLTIDFLLEKKFIIKYNVPCKNGVNKEELVINWTNLSNDNFSEENIINKFSEYNKSVDNENVKEIIKNTIDFVKFATQ